MGVFRLVRTISVMVVLVVGGLALWRRRDTVKQTWDSLGGVDGIKDSANQLMNSVGPLKNVFSQVARIK